MLVKREREGRRKTNGTICDSEESRWEKGTLRACVKTKLEPCEILERLLNVALFVHLLAIFWDLEAVLYANNTLALAWYGAAVKMIYLSLLAHASARASQENRCLSGREPNVPR